MVPVIAPGELLTVIAIVARQPVGKLYVMVAVPMLRPLTRPVVAFTVAIVMLSLLQVPPAGASLSADVNPTHTEVLPLIVPGSALTVTGKVAAHPVLVSV